MKTTSAPLLLAGNNEKLESRPTSPEPGYTDYIKIGLVWQEFESGDYSPEESLGTDGNPSAVTIEYYRVKNGT